MAKTTPKIRQDLIPSRAGIVLVTPYLDTGAPDYANTVSTPRNFLTSTQMSSSRTSDALPNGNGQDGEYPKDEAFTLAINTNVFVPAFQAMVANMNTVTDIKRGIPKDTYVTPKAASLGGASEYTFDNPAEYPSARDDGKIYLEIRDSWGQLFTSVESTEGMQALTYHYDSDQHKITFAAEYVNVPLSCNYVVAVSTSGIQYDSSVQLVNKKFLVETIAEMQSADTGEIMRCYQFLTKASISGDIPRITSQKDIVNTITYNFKSQPVPEGIVPYGQIIEPLATA